MVFQPSLLVRTNAVMGAFAVAIVLIAVVAINKTLVAPISERSAGDKAALLVLVAQRWVESSPELRAEFELELLVRHGLVVNPSVRELPVVELDELYYERLAAEVEKRIDRPVQLMVSDDLLWVNVPTPSGELVQLGFSSDLDDVQEVYTLVIALIVAAAIVVVASIFMVGRVAVPLGRAATAVTSFRGKSTFTPLPVTGPKEMRDLAESFNTMGREVTNLLENQSVLLAGISHDLRTPLARLRLMLEMLPENVDEEFKTRFERNLEVMNELIEGAIQVASGTSEDKELIRFVPFLSECINDISPSVPIEWDGTGDPWIELAPRAFGRTIGNLIENAEQHASGVSVRVDMSDDLIDIHVIDKGPGIPSGERDRVFQPFYRLEGSRDRRTGGSGLGLAIVSQLCDNHGWRISLSDSSAGGTDACLSISNG